MEERRVGIKIIGVSLSDVKVDLLVKKNLQSSRYVETVRTVQVIMTLSAYVPMIQLILILILVGYCGNHQYCTNVDKPTLPLLLKFPPLCPKSDCISIPARIGQKYWYFGILLLQDNTGNIAETLEHENQKNAEMINLKICKKMD